MQPLIDTKGQRGVGARLRPTCKGYAFLMAICCPEYVRSFSHAYAMSDHFPQ